MNSVLDGVHEEPTCPEQGSAEIIAQYVTVPGPTTRLAILCDPAQSCFTGDSEAWAKTMRALRFIYPLD